MDADAPVNRTRGRRKDIEVAGQDFDRDGPFPPGEDRNGSGVGTGPEVFPGGTGSAFPEEAEEDGSREEDWEGYLYDGEEESAPSRRSIFADRPRRPSFILAVIVNTFRTLVVLVLALMLSGLGAVVGIARAYVDTAPVLDLAAIDDQAQTSFIYDSSNNLITEYHGTENRVMVSVSTMPMALRNAFVAVEDARFYTHNGIDVKRIVGSFIANSITGSRQGGSTITQQLIKNTLLSSEQSYKRKIQEAYLAMQLEQRYTKEQILECYLNTIYMGEDYYGVKTAAYGYFGKNSLSDLSLRECAMLAGVCNSPYYYNPRRNYYTRTSDTVDYRAITDDRTDYVLRCMYENQFITREEYLAALDPSSARVLETGPESSDLYAYPHYVEYAVREAVRVLLDMNGLSNTSANRTRMEQELRTGGYRIYLAIDTDIQETVENTLYTWKDWPGTRDPEDSVYRARNSDGTYEEIPQPQAAAVVLDYRTGEIKAIVGSRVRPTQRKTLNRATDMNMPVGSAIKPIAVYAPAIENGAGAGSVLYNMELPITGWKDSEGQDTWPQNYGGSSYRGPETMRTALVKSDNTAAAWCMMNYVGVSAAADTLLSLGVSAEHINETPFGVTLGSSGITPMEMAVAFGVLGNYGVYQEPISVLAVTDSANNVLYDAHQVQERRQVFRDSTAWLVVDMLKDAVSKGTGTNAKIKGQTVAGKTGTNSDQRGVFFAGMTGWYCASVWIGHDNYKALSSKTTGGSAAAKLWQAFMSAIHTDKGLADRDIIEGSASEFGLVKVETCAVSGQLATDACRNDAMGYGTVTDWWPRENVPTASCQMHMSLEVCTETNLLAGAYCPSTAVKSVILIPYGHPLYRFIGTSYEPVLEDWLGPFASLRMTAGNATANNAAIHSLTCTAHTNASYASAADSSLIADAWTLLGSASAQLGNMSMDHTGYFDLVNAYNALGSVLSKAAPSADELYMAMTELTRAMANAR